MPTTMHGPFLRTEQRTRHVLRWLPPLLGTLVTAPLLYLSCLGVLMSTMACDSCTSAQADRFGDFYLVGLCCFGLGLALTGGASVTSYVLAARGRRLGAIVAFAVLTPLT